jgi:hypothetical protein
VIEQLKKKLEFDGATMDLSDHTARTKPIVDQMVKVVEACEQKSLYGIEREMAKLREMVTK